MITLNYNLLSILAVVIMMAYFIAKILGSYCKKSKKKHKEVKQNGF